MALSESAKSKHEKRELELLQKFAARAKEIEKFKQSYSSDLLKLAHFCAHRPGTAHFTTTGQILLAFGYSEIHLPIVIEETTNIIWLMGEMEWARTLMNQQLDNEHAERIAADEKAAKKERVLDALAAAGISYEEFTSIKGSL